MREELYTLEHQFAIAASSFHHAEQLVRAKYWTSAVSNAYQVALRAAAGLLYAQGTRPLTEREVRIAFASAFVSTGRSDARFDDAFRTLETMHQRADFDHDYVSKEGDARRALELAREFWAEAQRLGASPEP